MISIDNLSKTYPNGTQALNQITFEINKGIFGLLGPNGSGKTTLMRILAGLLHPTGGKVFVFGHNTASFPQNIREMLGYLPQELGLHDTLTVQQELDYFAILKGYSDTKIRNKHVGKAMERAGLNSQHLQNVKSLSGGQRRRLGIAIALLGEPKVMIVDEPTAGLDPAERVRFRNIITEISENRIVLLSTHIIEDISHICNSLGIIKEGKLLYTGTVESLIARAEGFIGITEEKSIAEKYTKEIISSRRTKTGLEYRLAGRLSELAITPVNPSLEDAYLLLMNDSSVFGLKA